VAVGCTSDADEKPATNTDRAGTAVVTAVLTRGPEDTFQTYLFASARAPSGELDLSGALELPDTLVAQNDEAIFIGDNESITFQRWEVNSDYTLSMVGEFSLQSYGINYINNPPLFFSATTAYYVDAPRGQVIVFNPTTMEVTGEIKVPELLREGYTAWIGPSHRVGDRYLASLLYTNEEWTAAAPDTTVGIIIEEDRAEPIRVLRDERGVGGYLSFVDERGDFYFAADGLSGDLALMGSQEVPSPRVLRVREGEDAIDDDFMLDLGELLDTPATFGFWPVSDTKFVVQAWASDVAPSDVLEKGDGGWGAPYFDWKFVDAATGKARSVSGLERSVPSSTIRLELDGTTYLQRTLEDEGRSELFKLNEDASAEKVAASSSGEFWFLGRVTRAKAKD
ncbi:MAG TPA: hypothetical protein VMF89_27355, partial [Polyangiales bacterium]|nr:hypothetical protein [Polyangiales bacterium]